MRNSFPGICFRCGLKVDSGTGHFRRDRGQWLVHHANFKGRGAVTCDMAKKNAEHKQTQSDAPRG